jgi:hypothetical protein
MMTGNWEWINGKWRETIWEGIGVGKEGEGHRRKKFGKKVQEYS